MSPPSLCPACQQLPTLKDHRLQMGTPGRCRGCNGELFTAWASGVTYRFAPAGAPAAPVAGASKSRATHPAHQAGRRARNAFVVGAVALVLVAGSVAAGVAVFRNRVGPGTDRLPARHSQVQVPSQPARHAGVEQRPVPDAQPGETAHGSRPEPNDAAAPFKRRTMTNEQDLLRELAAVPEASLYEGGPDHARDVASARQFLKTRPKGDAPPDAFVQQQMVQHPHLTQLPLRLGEACLLDRPQAQRLQTYADRLNNALAKARSDAREQSSPGSNAVDPAYADVYLAASLRTSLLETEHDKQFWKNPDAVPARQQILEGTTTPLRLVLVECLDGIGDRKAALALVRRALFDPEPQVRTAAVAALGKRDRAAYLPALLDGFRHPWPAAADHAAEALIALQARAALSALVDLLDEPRPDVVFEVHNGKPEVRAVRELVRVQHAANCLLCHPPSGSASDLLRRPIPGPGQSPLPGGGYRGPSSGILVRADVTFLRQDFSALLPPPPGHGRSEPVRYDYLVRTRAPTPAEREALPLRLPGGEHRQAVFFALRELTGQDAGAATADWRRVVAALHPVEQHQIHPGAGAP